MNYLTSSTSLAALLLPYLQTVFARGIFIELTYTLYYTPLQRHLWLRYGKCFRLLVEKKERKAPQKRKKFIEVKVWLVQKIEKKMQRERVEEESGGYS